MERQWKEIKDMEDITIEKNDILMNDEGEIIVANFENLDKIGNGVHWRCVGLLKEGETITEAERRIKKSL